MKLQFLGATDDVTGSMTLLHSPEGLLLVDAGLYQGTHDVTIKNIRNLPFDPKELKAIFLTHAHLDHCGFIPRLTKLGFRGVIYCTKPTVKLARIIMTDSAHLLAKTPNHPLQDFYEMKDVVVATSLFKSVERNKSFSAFGMTITFQLAGHILGAASIKMVGEKTYVFSGDLGRRNDPLLPPPVICPPCDILIMESTYGGKNREDEILSELEKFLTTIKRESAVGIIASFAVARSQMLITLIFKYYQENPEEKIRVVIDGPMMIEANHVYTEFAADTLCPLELKDALLNVEMIEHEREWNSLKKKEGPLIVITSSGMVSGGRIWRYLENWQLDSNAYLFLPGFQGIGTAGRDLSDGIRDIKDEEGKLIHWSGHVIKTDAFSSHAEQNDLLNWISLIDKKTEIYLNHGETKSKELLKEKLLELGFSNVTIAKL